MFILNIFGSADSLELIKTELRHKLPDIKSSHRCEALARGLGFRTHAAALAAAKTEMPIAVHVRGDLFTTYLRDHGFDARPELLYRAAAKVALRNVSERTPTLTMWGIGVGRPQRKQDGRWEDYRDMNIKFSEARAELVSDSAVEPFLASLAFFSRVTPTKTIREGTGSYWLKHIAENYSCTYPEGETLGPVYVANGILIAAALHSGFKMKAYTDDRGYDEPNVTFNMSKPCLVDLDCEIRPNDGRAQDRRRREEIKRRRY